MTIPKRRWLAPACLLALVIAACSSSATTDYPGIYGLDADGDGVGDNIAGCFACDGASCGNCVELSSDSTYVCTSSRLPEGDCETRGNLFDDGLGPYLCWYCYD